MKKSWKGKFLKHYLKSRKQILYNIVNVCRVYVLFLNLGMYLSTVPTGIRSNDPCLS